MEPVGIDNDKELLERLPPGQLTPYLFRLPARKRLEAVLQRADAASVIEALDVQDFFFFVQELGAEDSLPLLALARVDQLNHLFDIQWWNKDRLQGAMALDWLQKLAAASEEKLIHWLYQADFELLVTMFKQWIRVDTAPEDVDPLEAVEKLPRHTIDDTYYWEVNYPQYEDFIKGLLTLLFEINQGFYRELLHHILWAVDAEVEEEAYRFHRGRLEDHAIPDFFDALEIHRALQPQQVAAVVKDSPTVAQMPSTPVFALALLPERGLLREALSCIHEVPLLDFLQMELASLANKVFIVDQLPMDSPHGLRRAVDKTAAYLNLGLDLLSFGDVKLAASALENVPLDHLFRSAHTQVTKLRNRVQGIRDRGWPANWPTGFGCLDSRWLEPVELILRKTPMILRSSADETNPPGEDFFRHREDLDAARRFIQVIETAGEMLEALSVDPHALAQRLWHEGQIRDIADITLGTMVWTAAAQLRLTGRWEVEPIQVHAWDVDFVRLDPAVLEEIIRDWIAEVFERDRKHVHAAAYLDPLFKAYATEMGAFSNGSPPDARMVRFFLFTR
ncbi:MAG: hypothetical protein HPY84_09830 [Syntrophobacteraceae bacterium]|nr:hypothetical protein [Syntrophobacteraceae bacterium]